MVAEAAILFDDFHRVGEADAFQVGWMGIRPSLRVDLYEADDANLDAIEVIYLRGNDVQTCLF